MPPLSPTQVARVPVQSSGNLQSGFLQVTGGLPAHQALRRRNSGEGPAGAVPGDTRNPGVAGAGGAVAEASMPGYHTGNPEPGIPRAEGGAPPDARGGPPPGPGEQGRLAAGLGQIGGPAYGLGIGGDKGLGAGFMPTTPPEPPATPPTTPPAQSLGIMPSTASAQAGASPAATPAAPAAPMGPPPTQPPPQPPAGPPLAASGASPAKAYAPPASGVSPAYEPNPVPPPGTQTPTAQTPTAGSTVTQTPAKPVDQKWNTGNYESMAAAFKPGSGVKWWSNFADQVGEKSDVVRANLKNLPDPATYSGKPIAISGIAVDDRYFDPSNPDGVRDPNVAKLLGYTANWAAQLQQMSQESDDGTGLQRVKISEAWNKLYSARLALEQYGIKYDPFPASSVPEGGDAAAQSSYDENGRAQLSTTSKTYTGSGFDKETEMILARLKAAGGGDIKGADYLAALEMQQKRDEADRGKFAQDAAVNLAYDTRDQNLNDPRFAAYLSGVDKFNAEDPGQDWQRTRNRAATDAAKRLTSDRAELASAAGQRGVSGATLTGLNTGMNTEYGLGLTKQLGDLRQAENLDRRNRALQALGLAGEAAQMTAGLRTAGNSDIERLLMGQAPVGETGIEGAGNAAMDFSAASLAERRFQAELDAADDSGGFGDMLTSFLGTKGGSDLAGQGISALAGLIGI